MEKFLPIHQSLYYYTRNGRSLYWKIVVKFWGVLTVYERRTAPRLVEKRRVDRLKPVCVFLCFRHAIASTQEM